MENRSENTPSSPEQSQQLLADQYKDIITQFTVYKQHSFNRILTAKATRKAYTNLCSMVERSVFFKWVVTGQILFLSLLLTKDGVEVLSKFWPVVYFNVCSILFGLWAVALSSSMRSKKQGIELEWGKIIKDNSECKADTDVQIENLKKHSEEVLNKIADLRSKGLKHFDRSYFKFSVPTPAEILSVRKGDKDIGDMEFFKEAYRESELAALCWRFQAIFLLATIVCLCCYIYPYDVLEWVVNALPFI